MTSSRIEVPGQVFPDNDNQVVVDQQESLSSSNFINYLKNATVNISGMDTLIDVLAYNSEVEKQIAGLTLDEMSFDMQEAINAYTSIYRARLEIFKKNQELRAMHEASLEGRIQKKKLDPILELIEIGDAVDSCSSAIKKGTSLFHELRQMMHGFPDGLTFDRWLDDGKNCVETDNDISSNEVEEIFRVLSIIFWSKIHSFRVEKWMQEIALRVGEMIEKADVNPVLITHNNMMVEILVNWQDQIMDMMETVGSVRQIRLLPHFIDMIAKINRFRQFVVDTNERLQSEFVHQSENQLKELKEKINLSEMKHEINVQISLVNHLLDVLSRQLRDGAITLEQYRALYDLATQVFEVANDKQDKLQKDN